MSNIVQDVQDLIAYHFAMRGREPDGVVMPATQLSALKVELGASMVVHPMSSFCLLVNGILVGTALGVTELLAGVDGEQWSSMLRLPSHKKKSECECGAFSCGHPGHSWFCKLYQRNPYDG